jgi:endonuclease/exonuclease/phosphatase family metal-dependent hydrolase
LRVATYNVHRSLGSDGHTEPARIVGVVEELEADILALQEVEFRTGQPGDLLERLRDATSMDVIEGVTLRDERGHYGNALLSRLPVLEVRRLDLSVPRREPRGAIDAELDAGVPMQVLATHLGLRPFERRRQVRQLLGAVEASDAPVKVLLGDLNEWFLWGRPVRWLQRVFGDNSPPATFPAKRPVLALDRLWVAPPSSIVRAYAHDTPLARVASDHLPLVGEIRSFVSAPDVVD